MWRIHNITAVVLEQRSDQCGINTKQLNLKKNTSLQCVHVVDSDIAMIAFNFHLERYILCISEKKMYNTYLYVF